MTSRTRLAVLALAFTLAYSVGLHAQTRPEAFVGFASVTPREDLSFPAGDASFYTIDMSQGAGAEAGIVIPFTERVGIELSAVTAKLPVRAHPRTAPFEEFAANDIKLTPVSLVLQYRFGALGLTHPYVSAGASYLTAGDVTGDLEPIFAKRLEIGDDVGWVAGAGVDVYAHSHVGIRIDVRHMSFSPSLRLIPQAGTQMSGKADIAANIASADLVWHF